MTVLKIYSDGGSRGNPGKAACAFVVYSGNKLLHEESSYLGVTTNNQAEYYGVLNALNWLSKEDTKLSYVNFYLDSELVVKQLNGQYKVKSKELKSLYDKCKRLIKEFAYSIVFTHVPRVENKKADNLLNECLDNQAS